jgi:hypothetical protein
MDVLRRAAGARRPPRWWDRGLWACGLAVAVIGIGIGSTAVVDERSATPRTATVVSCSTDLHLYGRWLGDRTTCEVAIGTRTVEIETERSYPPGSEISLLVNGDSVLDPGLERDTTWWLPAGLVAGAGTWWMGFPPRKQASTGRHSAKRRNPA